MSGALPTMAGQAFVRRIASTARGESCTASVRNVDGTAS
jgi:hypothetical protein